MDWADRLDDDEQRQWDEFVSEFRRDALEKIAGSHVAVALAPPTGEIDPKMCMELGAMIMLDKPIVVVAAPGQVLPERLRRASDRIVHTDIDTKAGQRELARVLSGMRER